MGARKAVTPIGDIVKTVFERLEREKTLTKEDVEEKWREIAGREGAAHTRPVTLRKGILTVFVDSSGWVQQMNFEKRKVLKQLKRVFGKDKISGIQFKIGEL